jgi:hypothetical protein
MDNDPKLNMAINPILLGELKSVSQNIIYLL